MGNLLISPAYQKKIEGEHHYAQELLSIVPRNDQERELIERTRGDQVTKSMMAMGVGFSLALSLKRYFPDNKHIAHPGSFFVIIIAIVFPCFCVSTIFTNREVIEQLEYLGEIRREEILAERKKNRQIFKK